MKNVATTACIFMVVAVAAERYHAICHPMKYKPSTAFYNGLVAIVAVVVNLPKFTEFQHNFNSFRNDSNQTLPGALDYWTTDLNENPTYVIFSSYHEVAVIGFLPLVCLCFLNYKIYVKIKKSSLLKNRSDCCNRSSSCSFSLYLMK